MTGQEIVARAKSCKLWAYWYGAKHEVPTQALADRLQKENPSVWGATYKRKALNDIGVAPIVCDCSGLVCYCYGIKDIGSYQIKEKFKEWKGSPKPGMIAWKPGHVAIISDTQGHIIEMRSIDYDYQETRYRKAAGLDTILYDPDIDYNCDTPSDQKPGWHSDVCGWWYRHTQGTGKGTYYHDCVKIINGHCYVFDSDGYICEMGAYLGRRVSPKSDRGWIDG